MPNSIKSKKRDSLPDLDAKKRRKSSEKLKKRKKDTKRIETRKKTRKSLDSKGRKVKPIDSSRKPQESRKSLDGLKRIDSKKSLDGTKKVLDKPLDVTKKPMESKKPKQEVKKKTDTLTKKDIKKIVKASSVPFLRGSQGLGNIFNMPSRPLLKPLLKKTPHRPSPLLKLPKSTGKPRPVSPLVPLDARISPNQSRLKRKRSIEDDDDHLEKKRAVEKPPRLGSPSPAFGRDVTPSPVPSVLSTLSYLADVDRGQSWQKEFSQATPLLKPLQPPRKPSSKAGSVTSMFSQGFRASRPMSVGSGTTLPQKISSTAPAEFRHPALPRTLVNRELSWLDFNARVLSQSQLRSLSVLDRCKFLAIFSSNLDEFWQVRVGRLVFAAQAMANHDDTETSQDGLTPSQQLAHIRQRTAILCGIQDRIWMEEMKPALQEVGVNVSSWDDLELEWKEMVSNWFMNEVFVVCTPLSVDGTHPFPRLANLSINVAVVLTTPGQGGVKRLAIVPLPLNTFPRLINVGKICGDDEKLVLVPLEEIIAGNLQEMFPGMVIESCSFFRLTRYSDLRVDDVPETNLSSMPSPATETLRQRIERHVSEAKRTEPALRIEVGSQTDEFVVNLLTSSMGIHKDDVYHSNLLDLNCLWSLVKVSGEYFPELKEEVTFEPRTPWEFDFDPKKEPGKIFEILASGRDILVHHPYHSFKTTVESFVESAAEDAGVMAIKLTLYRTSDEPSNALLGALQRAAERGKQVVVLVELKARFHEILNVGWAKVLERAGAHVVYGLEHLKTHAKICLVIRREQSDPKIRRYLHVSTGNYNAKTAGTYEDIGMFTADPILAQDASDLFNYLTGWSRHADYQRFVVAPLGMRADLTDLIASQASLGERGRIFIKCNSLSDSQIIQALYAASQKGCRIDVVVRGICCLRPGVKGLSENIRVRSMIGKYLEHSRIYRFGPGSLEELEPVDGPTSASAMKSASFRDEESEVESDKGTEKDSEKDSESEKESDKDSSKESEGESKVESESEEEARSEGQSEGQSEAHSEIVSEAASDNDSDSIDSSQFSSSPEVEQEVEETPQDEVLDIYDPEWDIQPLEPNTITYIGSADLMHRNISRRVEILVPVLSKRNALAIDKIVAQCLNDECLSWTLQDDRWYPPVGDGQGGLDAHVEFERGVESLPILRSFERVEQEVRTL